jgi:hypothetical protein
MADLLSYYFRHTQNEEKGDGDTQEEIDSHEKPDKV